MGTTPIASAADRTAADRTHNPPRDMSSIRITGFAFLLFATLLHAQEDAYVNEVLPEHELTEMSTQEVPSENAKLQAALNEIDDPQLLHLLQQRKNHAQKLTDTIAQKSKIVQAVNNIVTKLKSGYDSHKTTAQKAIDRLSVAKNQITDAQFKPLAAGAMLWCAARKTQLEKQKSLGQAKKEMDVKQKVEIPAAVLQWQAATTWRIDYKKGQTYTTKPFTPSSALQSAFNTARQAFWEKSKKKFEADETHNTAIDKSNNAAVAFKTSIDTLADEEVAACGKYDKIAEKAIVEAFNTANAQRSGVRRALQIVLCHANNLGEADPTNKAAQCISNTVKTKTNYNTNVYRNLDVPSVSCPTKDQVLASIKAKKSKFNFHFKKAKTLLATDTGGELVSDQGWTPTSGACAEVNKHPIKGQKCKDVACPTGKMKKSGVADKYAPSPTLCCRNKKCSDWTCPPGQKKKSNSDNTVAHARSVCCQEACTSSLKKHRGSLSINCEEIHKYCNLEEVTGTVRIDGRKCTNLKGLDKLTKIGGALRIGTHGGTLGLTSMCGFGNSKTRVGRDIGIKAGSKICFQAGCGACAKFGRCDYPRCGDGSSTNSLSGNYGMKWCTDQKEIDAQKAGQPCPS